MSQFQDGVAYEGKGPRRLASGGGGRVVKPARAGDPHCTELRIASTCSVPPRASIAAIMVVSLVETPVTMKPRQARAKPCVRLSDGDELSEVAGGQGG